MQRTRSRSASRQRAPLPSEDEEKTSKAQKLQAELDELIEIERLETEIRRMRARMSQASAIESNHLSSRLRAPTVSDAEFFTGERTRCRNFLL